MPIGRPDPGGERTSDGTHPRLQTVGPGGRGYTRGVPPLHCDEVTGRLPAVVLLHHGGGALTVWDPFTPGVAGGRRLLRYDRRGFGASPRDARHGPHLFDEDAEDLAALLRERDAFPAHLVGHSDGASVALLAAARHPDLVLSVAAVSGHLRADERTVATLRSFGPVPGWGEPVLDQYRAWHGDDWEGVITAWYELWTAGGLDGWDMEADLDAVRCPVLVVHDRGDALAGPEHAEAMARRMPHARLSWYDTGRHEPHRADRARFEAELHALWAVAEQMTAAR